MKAWMVVLGLCAAMAPAAADEAPSKAVWGALLDMAGHDYISVRDGAPQVIASFHWEKMGSVLAVDGFASTGPTFKSHYSINPATGKLGEDVTRDGKVTHSDFTPTKDGFVEEGLQDGVQTRRTFHLVTANSFVSHNEGLVKGAWKTMRPDSFFIQASPAWVKQLGWRDNSGNHGK